MNIRMVKEAATADAITHAGVFHADEVMATVILAKTKKKLKVCRVFRLPEAPGLQGVVYDIGGGRFDHHQKGGNGRRENGIPYAAAGLIWKEYGKDVLEGREGADYIWKEIDRNLMQGIDAVDNGVYPKADYPAQCASLSYIISTFNLNWDEEGDSDEAFLKAVSLAEDVFDHVCERAASGFRASRTVKDAIEKATGNIMVLDRFVPWQETLFSEDSMKSSEIHFVVYPSVRGGYNWQCVPSERGGFDQRKPVPVEWRGLTGEKLQAITGVKTAAFCHQEGFIGSAETFQDAYKMAELAERG